MQKHIGLGVLGLGLAFPLVSNASVISFMNPNHGYAFYGGYNVLMYGQGAASDPGNNVWNGFDNSGSGPGSTAFYGPGNTDSGHGVVPNGNPGNPYAWSNAGQSTGHNLFSPTNPGAALNTIGNAYSDGTISPITLSLSGIGGDNGALGGITVNTPGYIFSEASLVQGANLGTFTLGSVPAGTYNLFLYGSNYDATRGAAFTVSSGTALGGITQTTNIGSRTNSYVLGQDYVEFLNVTPTAGVISGTWGAVSNSITGLSGEGDFNGLQLVSVPEPTSIGLIGLAGISLLSRRSRKV